MLCVLLICAVLRDRCLVLIVLCSILTAIVVKQIIIIIIITISAFISPLCLNMLRMLTMRFSSGSQAASRTSYRRRPTAAAMVMSSINNALGGLCRGIPGYVARMSHSLHPPQHASTCTRCSNTKQDYSAS